MALIDAISTPIFVIQLPSGIVASANKKAEEMSGFTFDEMQGKRFADFFNGRSVHVVEQMLVSALHAPEIHELDLKFQRKSRRTFTAEATCKRVDGDKGMVVVVSVNDVEKFKKMQREAKEASDLWDFGFGRSPFPMLVLDASGNVVQANKACSDFFIISAESLRHKRVSEVLGRGVSLGPDFWTKLAAEKGVSFPKYSFKPNASGPRGGALNFYAVGDAEIPLRRILVVVEWAAALANRQAA